MLKYQEYKHLNNESKIKTEYLLDNKMQALKRHVSSVKAVILVRLRLWCRFD